jgi:hypothetical protein
MLGGDFLSSVRYRYVTLAGGEGRGLLERGGIAMWRAYFRNSNTCGN